MKQEYQNLFNVPKNLQAKYILNAIISLIQMLFPHRLRAVYTLGSRLDNTSVDISDIDVIFFFKGNWKKGEQPKTEELIKHLRYLSPIRLDISIGAESDKEIKDYCRQGYIGLHLGGKLFWGENILHKLPVATLENYKKWIVQWPWIFISTYHKNRNYPLKAPNPEDPYLGYTKIIREKWYPAHIKQGTKELVAGIFWTATAILALEKDMMIATRNECLKQYPKKMGGKWSSFLLKVYKKCKTEWGYKVPESKKDREELKKICRKTLDFYNFALKNYLLNL